MALILKGAVRLYYYLNDEIADPRTENWFLMRTPWPGMAIIVVYLMSVFQWLPRFMAKRPAYDLRSVIAAYNALQILLCGYVVFKSLTLGWFSHYRLFCQPVDEGPHGVEYAWHVCYGYFYIKIIDLLDTVFFLLRKKQNQVTFLHVYHHFGMIAVAWGIVKWVPGGHMTMLVTINSFVHMVMYTYYLLTSWDDSFKYSLWWKKYVTQIQILQFSYLMIHFGALLVKRECRFPPQPAYIMFPQNLFMVLMFGDFYYRTYLKTSDKSA
ncbi:very long chain fatty acid elongase AAEL008004-like isoform X1 [Choristoneura fumiferana]|uniref:very long chain fatty acid elongase AAEL008004-like isoform X1 n=2 Tax=Choristoneura fumiferana TaxID=7141 RepID=UPI003D159829